MRLQHVPDSSCLRRSLQAPGELGCGLGEEAGHPQPAEVRTSGPEQQTSHPLVLGQWHALRQPAVPADGRSRPRTHLEAAPHRHSGEVHAPGRGRDAHEGSRQDRRALRLDDRGSHQEDIGAAEHHGSLHNRGLGSAALGAHHASVPERDQESLRGDAGSFAEV